ncbi:MAG TPA: DinB family protein [Parafilimonas sp.]|nr:DinB family protein [Parafilimonas sp.]
MNILNVIAMHITDTYNGENWTGVNISNTLKDVSWQRAQQKTEGSQNTIASLVHHLYYWNGIMMERIKGINPSIPDTNGFDVNELKNENDWNELKEKTHQSFMQLASAVENFPEEKLFEISPTGKSSYYKNFQGIVEHAHYHLGQIVILKKLIKQDK